jgi:hypothetical protein
LPAYLLYIYIYMQESNFELFLQLEALDCDNSYFSFSHVAGIAVILVTPVNFRFTNKAHGIP